MKLSAQNLLKSKSGFAPIILIIIIVVVVGLVIIGIASGALKGSFKISKNNPQSQESTANVDKNTQIPEVQTSPSPKIQALTKTFTNANLKISINYPENWTVEETSSGANIYAPKTDANSLAKNDAALIVTTTPLGNMKGYQLSTIADVMKNQMGSFLPGATVAKSSSTQVNGKEAHLFDLNYYNEGQNYPSKFYLLVDEENLYGVITSVSESKIDMYEETLNAAVNSFNII